jgi:hypothetical protein
VSTAIAVYNSGGCVGRCDAKCHNASSPDCDCICGGRLHGTGGRAIEQNTRDLLGDELTDELAGFAERNGLDVSDLRVELPDRQLELIA